MRDAAEGVLFGRPGSERLRPLYLVLHQRVGGRTFFFTSLVAAPDVTPIVDHPRGVRIAGARLPDATFVVPARDLAAYDEVGYGVFHEEMFGRRVDENAVAPAGHRSVVAVRDNRVVGWLSAHETTGPLLVATAGRDWFDAPRCLFVPPLKKPHPAVESVWVARDFRRSSIASEMVRAAAATWGLRPTELAYGLPFSRAGFRLARSVTGGRFLAATPFVVAGAADGADASRLARPDATLDLGPIPTDLLEEGRNALAAGLGPAVGRWDSGAGVKGRRPRRPRRRRASRGR